MVFMVLAACATHAILLYHRCMHTNAYYMQIYHWKINNNLIS